MLAQRDDYLVKHAAHTLTFVSVDGLVALQGGLPILVGGKVIGAVGVRGAIIAQHEIVAATALAGVTEP